MGVLQYIIKNVFYYATPKMVNIRNVPVGIVSLIVRLSIVGYIIGYVIIYQKGYQEFSEIESAVTTKVKGSIFTNFSNDEFNPEVKNPDLYRRIWDVSDYVIPPTENGAVFVTTNVVITDNQKQSVCPEDVDLIGARCHPDENNCTAGLSLPHGNGVMTGKCVEYSKENYTCEIHAWCPLENDVLPLKNEKALLADSENFTLLIKNFVEFPKFQPSFRRNIKHTAKESYLTHCRYSGNNLECPVFRLGDIVALAGQDFQKMALKGGVIAIVIDWDCNFDFDKKFCFPTYTFRRLDDPNSKLAPGLNFRHANYYSSNSRTLYKLYGIEFIVRVQGQAGKLDVVPFLLNVGAGLGLLAVEIVVCDIVLLYLTKKKKFYKSKKYEIADPNDADLEQLTSHYKVRELPE